MTMKMTLDDFLGTEEFDEFTWELMAAKMTLDLLADVHIRMKELGIKQKDLADAMGVTPAAISKLLSNGSNPRFSTVAKLAEALGCDVVAPRLIPHEGRAPVVNAESASPQIQVVTAARKTPGEKRTDRAYELH
ncbi:MAG: helix-turn-helix transcriptional regulator [Coriobacteriales bacterium]